MIKMIPLECPNCKAELSVDQNKEFIFCEYCGTKILVSDDNNRHFTYHDEAEIIRAETERAIQLHEIEKEKNDEKRVAASDKAQIGIIIAAILLIAIGRISHSGALSGTGLLILLICGVYKFYAYDKKKNAGKIRAKSGAAQFLNQPIQTVIAELQGAGFYNIQSIPLYDLKRISIFGAKSGTVSAVSIDGNNNFSAGARFYPGALVSISYHCYVDEVDVVSGSSNTGEKLVDAASAVASVAILAHTGRKIAKDILKNLPH